jgi:hypothetical protein
MLRRNTDGRRAVPLSAPTPRKEIHTRTIVLRGYQRDDGLYDVEAHLTDVKPYGFENADRGFVEPGTPLHGMWMRMTVDEALNILTCEADTEFSPYGICPTAAPNFARLAGLRIRPGFLKEANARIGGTQGCTHLRELLQQMATTAYQAVYPAAARRAAEAGKSAAPRPADGGKPLILNTCLAYGTDSPVVRRQWPHLYTGPGTGPGAGPDETPAPAPAKLAEKLPAA